MTGKYGYPQVTRVHQYAVRFEMIHLSRTNKDRPIRVRELDAALSYRYEWHDHRNGHCEIYSGTTLAEHDADYGECNYWLSFKHYTPYREERRIGFYGPFRAKDRVDFRRMTREFNTSGNADRINDDEWLPLNSHRHAMFSGGWWD